MLCSFKSHFIFSNLRILFLIIIFIALFMQSFAKEQDTLKRKPTIFVYNEDDSPYTADFGGGIGTNNAGFKAGLIANIDIYHFLISYQSGYTWPGGERITDGNITFGYRYRNNYVMFSTSTGFGWQKFKSTSSSSYYNDYKEETVNAFPINAQLDIIVTDYFAIGGSFGYSSSSRQHLIGAMFTLKFGVLRNVY